MARAAQDAAQGASNQYKGYAGAALNNFNSQAGQTNDAISSLQQNNPYTSKANLQNQNLLTSGAMDANDAAAKQNLQDAALRTGTNTASFGHAVAENARAGQRTMDNYNAGTAEQNVDRSTQLQQGLIGDRQRLADSQARVLGTTSGAQTNANGQLVNLNGQQDAMWGQIVAGAAAGAGAACPAQGSLYLMADGGERAVETLVVGDLIAGIDGEPQIIEEIQSDPTAILRVTTANGLVARNSRTHAFALPYGGFTVAVHSLGKTILTKDGPSKVVGVVHDGEETVYNVITDGSHTYRADGVWALGVGEAERHVTMERWAEIGDYIEVAALAAQH